MGRAMVKISATLWLLAALLLGGCEMGPASESTSQVPLPHSQGQNPLLSSHAAASPYTGETAAEMGQNPDAAPQRASGKATTNAPTDEAPRSAKTAPPKVTPTDLVPPATGVLSTDPLASETAARPLTKAEEGEKLNIINAIVAEVNGEVITREDLLRNIRSRMPLWSTDNPEEFSRQVRTELRERLQIEIRWQLLLQEARKQVKEEQTQAIDKEIEKERKRQIASFGGSPAKWREKLAETGATEETWKKAQTESILVNQFMATTFDPKISITRQELVDYYEKVRQSKYELPTQAHMQLIKLRLRDFPNLESLMARAKTLAARARAGEDFNKLAAENPNEAPDARKPGEPGPSDPAAPKGTDYGMLRKGSFREEAVDKALFSLPVGSVSDPIPCGRYVYIIKVLERQEGRTVPFTEVQEEVTNEVRRAKRMKMVGDYVNNLARKSFIKIHEENL